MNFSRALSLLPFPAGASDSAAAAGGADADADEEAPAKFKPELKVDEETWNVLFNNKAKLHVRVKKDSGATDWESRGLGMLTMRQPKQGENSGKTYIMFSTDVVSGRGLRVSLPCVLKSAAVREAVGLCHAVGGKEGVFSHDGGWLQQFKVLVHDYYWYEAGQDKPAYRSSSRSPFAAL
jgi:hypothetical protein